MSDMTFIDGGHIGYEYINYDSHRIHSDILPIFVGKDTKTIVVTCGEERYVFDAGKVAARILELFADCEVEE